jgi:hypothetical protein
MIFYKSLIFVTVSGLTWYSATFYFSDFQPADHMFTPEPVIQHFRRRFGDKTLNNSTPKSDLVIPVQNTVNSSYTEESYTQKVTSSDLLSRTLEQRTENSISKTTLENVVPYSERLTSDSGGGITVIQSTLGKSTSDKSASEKSNTEKSNFEKSTAGQNPKVDSKQDKVSALENPAIKKILYFNKVSQIKGLFLRIFMSSLLLQSLRLLHEIFMCIIKIQNTYNNDFFRLFL